MSRATFPYWATNEVRWAVGSRQLAHSSSLQNGRYGRRTPKRGGMRSSKRSIDPI